MTAVASDYESLLESINKEINRYAEREHPLLKRHLDLNSPVGSWKHEWVDKNLVSLRTTLKTALASTTPTVVTLSSGTNSPARIKDNVTHLLFGTELMLVVSTITIVTNESKYCVTRAQRSTTAATFAANTEVIILNDREEGFSAGLDDSQKGVRRENYSTIVETQLKLSGSSVEYNTAGMENTLASQRKELIPELLKQLENHFIYGIRYTDGVNNTDHASGGLIWHAQNYSNSADQNGAAIDKNLIEGVISTYIRNGGNTRKICLLASVNQQRQINEIKGERILQSQSEKKLDDTVEAYNFGTNAMVEIMYHPDLRDDEVIFYQKDKAKIRPIKNRQLFKKKLPEDGDFVREMVCGEYVIELHNADKLIFHKYNLNTI